MFPSHTISYYSATVLKKFNSLEPPHYIHHLQTQGQLACVYTGLALYKP